MAIEAWAEDWSAIGELRAAVDRGDKAAAAAALSRMSEHAKDLIWECPAKKCKAPAFAECRPVDGDGAGNGVVHFGRRLKRLLSGIR